MSHQHDGVCTYKDTGILTCTLTKKKNMQSLFHYSIIIFSVNKHQERRGKHEDGGIKETSAFVCCSQKRGRAENDMAALCAFSADVFTQPNNREQELFRISRKQTHTQRRKTWKHNKWHKASTNAHRNLLLPVKQQHVSYFSHLDWSNCLTLQ